MTKNIVKELIIVLLLCLAIILLLGILLYEYVPMNKTVPNTEAYATPNNVKAELKEENANGDLIQTYEIDSSDLDDFKRVQNYKPGKADPFSSYDETPSSTGTNTTLNNSSTGNTTSGQTDNTANTTNNNTSNDNTNSQTNNNNTTTNETTSGGHFYKPTGTK